MKRKQKGAPHGSSGYHGGRRTKVVAPLRRSAAPSQASAVHERGPGSIPPEVVQSPAGPIEALTQGTEGTARSAPKNAPGTVATESSDRTGPAQERPIPSRCPVCDEPLVPAPAELAPLTWICPLDPVFQLWLGRPWPTAHPHNRKSSRDVSAHGNGLCASTPRLPDDSVAEQASPAPQADPLRAVDPTASVCTACGCELPQRGLCAECEADWHLRGELKLIGHAAGVCADEVRAVLNAPRAHWCPHCGRDLSPNAEWCMYCGREVGSVQEQAADEPALSAGGSVTPFGDAPEGAASALGKIGSYSSNGENIGVPESAACGPEKHTKRAESDESRPQPMGLLPCPKCGDEHRDCANGCRCATCRGLHTVAAYTCEQCGAPSVRLHRTTRRGSAEDRPWLCDTCWSREVAGPRSEHVYASGVKYRPETAEDRAAVADLVALRKSEENAEEQCKRCARLIDCGLRKAGFFCEEASGSIMRSTEKPAQRPPINVMPERPLVTALDRMCAWLEHSELTADQSRLCESLLKKLQLCSASVMNAQLRRSWKPRDAS